MSIDLTSRPIADVVRAHVKSVKKKILSTISNQFNVKGLNWKKKNKATKKSRRTKKKKNKEDRNQNNKDQN